jgi:hypothetical protein
MPLAQGASNQKGLSLSRETNKRCVAAFKFALSERVRPQKEAVYNNE